MRPSDALLLEPRPLLVRKALAKLLGLQEAIQLQQLHWLLDHYDSRSVELDGRRWLKGELSFWTEQFPWASEATIRRAWDALKSRGVIERQRGREASVFTINYDALDKIVSSDQSDRSYSADRADGTDQIDRSPRIEEVVEERGEEQPAAGAASGQLFAPPSPAPVSPPSPAPSDFDQKVERVWAHYEKVFAGHFRLGLTPARRTMITKGLKAVEEDVTVCLQAINGLKSYRTSDPHGSKKDHSIDAIFKTRPGGSNLTDQILYWAGHADSGNRGGSDMLAEYPAAIRDKVRRYRLQVVQMYQEPHLSGVKERGENALLWLAGTAKEEPVVENDRVTGWRRTG